MGRVTPMLLTLACGMAQLGKRDFRGGPDLPPSAALAASMPTVGPEVLPRCEKPSVFASTFPKPVEPPAVAASVRAAALPGVVGSTVKGLVLPRDWPPAIVPVCMLCPPAAPGTDPPLGRPVPLVPA